MSPTMHSIKRVYLALAHRLFGDPVHRAYERVLRAAQLRARRSAECEYHSYLIAFYEQRAKAIDPHVSAACAWEFAEAKQQVEDHLQERQVEHQRLAQASGDLEACKTRLASLQAKFPGRRSPWP
jgi:hypothetical protein